VSHHQADPRLQLVKELLLQPIAFHRVFAKLCGDPGAGLFLSQAYYWAGRLPPERDGWFYKSQEEWESETTLGRHKQDRIRGILRLFPFWQEDLRGVPARLWFRLDQEKLHEAILQFAGKRQTGIRKPANKRAGKQQSFNREYLTESSTETDDDRRFLADFSDEEEHLKDKARQELLCRYPKDGGFIEIALERIHDRSKQPPATVEYFLEAFERLLQSPSDVKVVQKRLGRREKFLGIESQFTLSLSADAEERRQHFNSAVGLAKKEFPQTS